MDQVDGSKAARKGARAARRRIATEDIASYVETMIRGIREVTQSAPQADLRPLDDLLAATEAEAAKLSARNYH